MLEKLADLDAQHAVAVAGGGEKYVARHHARGKLTARERIELLLDPGSAFLELSPLAGWGSDFTVGASVVTGIGVVEGVECMISANDPTVKGGASNPWTVKKIFRASQIAEENNLPTISLVESGGADLPTQKEIFIPGGKLFRDLTRASARRQPTIALVFGNSTAGGAYVPGMSDYTVFVRGGAKVFLGGPPLVKMATGEESDDESLGGAEMHARVSGLADYLAEDEHDAIRIGRRIVARLNRRKPRAPRARPALAPQPSGCRWLSVQSASERLETRSRFAEPDADPEGLLDLIPTDLKEPFDPREVIVRIVDGTSERNGRPFDEFKPLYGTSLVTGWAEIHGRPVGILANAQGVLFSEEAQKATQFIQLANSADTPLLFLHNTTGYMVGKDYEQGGIIKHGAMMINAVSNSTVPHLSVIMGASYGAGNYGMNGRAFDPRFLFTWPSAKSAVMGPAQLAGVLEIVAQQSAESKGETFDAEGVQGRQGLRRGLGRGAVAALLPVRDALRRRRHRPPRHPYRARDLPERHRERSDQGRRRIRGVPTVISRLLVANRGEIARRVFATCRRLGIETRGGPLRRRRAPAVRGRGRRRRPAARATRPRTPTCASTRSSRRRAPCRRRRGPPGLRLPLRERRLRARRDRRGPHLGRPAARGDRGDGRQGPCQGDRARRPAFPSCRRLTSRPRPTSRCWSRRPPAVVGAACVSYAPSTGSPAEIEAARAEAAVGLRGRHGLRRAVRRGRPPRRGAGRRRRSSSVVALGHP